MKGDPEVPKEGADPEGDAATESVSGVAGWLSQSTGPGPRYEAATGSHLEMSSLDYAEQTLPEESGHKVGLRDTKIDASELGALPSP